MASDSKKSLARVKAYRSQNHNHRSKQSSRMLKGKRRAPFKLTKLSFNIVPKRVSMRALSSTKKINIKGKFKLAKLDPIANKENSSFKINHKNLKGLYNLRRSKHHSLKSSNLKSFSKHKELKKAKYCSLNSLDSIESTNEEVSINIRPNKMCDYMKLSLKEKLKKNNFSDDWKREMSVNSMDLLKRNQEHNSMYENLRNCFKLANRKVKKFNKNSQNRKKHNLRMLFLNHHRFHSTKALRSVKLTPTASCQKYHGRSKTNLASYFERRTNIVHKIRTPKSQLSNAQELSKAIFKLNISEIIKEEKFTATMSFVLKGNERNNKKNEFIQILNNLN